MSNRISIDEFYDGSVTLSKSALYVSFKLYEKNDEDFDIKGDLKWDGCVNWTTNDHMNHLCGKENLKNLMEAFRKLLIIAAELMPERDLSEDWGA